MIRLLLIKCSLLVSLAALANTIPVRNMSELSNALKKVQPGDTVVLQSGEWKDAQLALNVKGTSDKLITFKAEKPGSVRLTGNSWLKLGGEYIVVDGFYFTNGYAGKNAVIDFRSSKKIPASNCRVTNTVIDNYNNQLRMEENYWISFSGRHNRLDHSTFRDKKNMGVLLAVILDDENSRENFHSIDHNLFGRRPPLGSNSGEIIRVGVSQHCQFNSNTRITDNLFEQCDGETEIISIKSGGNLVRNNVFKECQGSVVLRHGDNNTVENNLFLGNDKEGTGGVRVINKGQWVVNNYFYKCRGVDFRSPLSVMNGIPNSPAHRYVQVTDAVIANNTFYNCSSASFCEGSDAERTLPPDNVFLINNIFFNDRDSLIYRVFDNMSGFTFEGNLASLKLSQELSPGFARTAFAVSSNSLVPMPAAKVSNIAAIPDSLQAIALQRLQRQLPARPGFGDTGLVQQLQANAFTQTGAGWLARQPQKKIAAPVSVTCRSAEEVHQQLAKGIPLVIRLSNTSYDLDKPFLITSPVIFTGNKKATIRFSSAAIPAIFTIAGDGHLTLNNLVIDGKGVRAESFIASDSKGSSLHYGLEVNNCSISGLNRENGCQHLFYAYKSMLADKVQVRNSSFTNNAVDGIIMNEEKDDKGYYNAEKIYITNNTFSNMQGILLQVYRGGNDESTLGPQLFFTGNRINDCRTTDNKPLLDFTGVQITNIFANDFRGANPSATLVSYKDIVRARHYFEKNSLAGSGNLAKNEFVIEKNNIIK